MGIAYAKSTTKKSALFARRYVVMVRFYNWHVTMVILLMVMDAHLSVKLSLVIHARRGGIMARVNVSMKAI
jgi:hypothetical protein